MINHSRVIEVWQQGYTYRDAGKKLGITGERVRQIVIANHTQNCSGEWVSPNRKNGPYCPCVQQHRRGQATLKAQKLSNPNIEADFQSGKSIQDIARAHRIDQQTMWNTAKGYSNESKAIRKTNLWKANRTRRSNDALAGHIKAVAEKLGRTPTRAEYDANRENGWPSSQTVCIRFRHWSDAIRAAGLTPNSRSEKVSRPRSDKHWTETRMIDALHYLYADIGEVPSISAYREISTSTAWLPSDQVIRRIYRWPDVRLKIMNEHADWHPTYSKLDLVDPHASRRRGRPKKAKKAAVAPAAPVTNTNEEAPHGPLWAA